MTISLDGDEQAYIALAARRRASAQATALVTVPLAAAILVIDYRLMIFALVVLSFAVLAVIEAVRAARARDQLRRCRLHLEADAVVLEAAASARILTSELSVRALPDALILVERKAPEYRRFVVPFTPPAADALLEELGRRGVPVSFERQIVPAMVSVFLGLFASFGMGVLAGALALVGSSMAVLNVWRGEGGDPWLAAAFLGGAVLALGLRTAALRVGFALATSRK